MSFNYESISPEYAVSGQLGPADMAAVASAGFRSVIINRPDGEGGAEQPTSDSVMEAARRAGLQVHYQPVVSKTMTQRDAETLARLLETLPGPVLSYCRSGSRCKKLYRAATGVEPLPQ